MPDPLVVGLVALVGGLVGFVVALLVRRSLARGSETTARANSERLVAEARAKQKEIILEAKDEAIKLAKTSEAENRERRAELQRYETRLDKKDEQLDQRLAAVDQRERRLVEKELELEADREKVVQLQGEQRTELARVAGLSMDEARGLLLKRVEDEMRDITNRKVHDLEAEARETADVRAREIITMALQRYAAEHTAEHTVTVVALPSDDMKGRIIGREGRNIRTLETLTGVDLIIDDTPEAVVVSGFDPIRREVAKRALERLLVDGRIHPARIEEMVAKAKTEIDQVMKEAAESAIYEVGLAGLHPDLVRLLGRLHFRTSYGQNVLRHSVEVAHVAGMLASETGYDPQTRKRAEQIDDLSTARLSRDIAQKIQESLQYPGQIKVTVIRETRAVEYAK